MLMNFFEYLERVACLTNGHPGYEVMVSESGWILQVCGPCRQIDVYVDEDAEEGEVMAEVMVYLAEHFPEFAE